MSSLYYYYNTDNIKRFTYIKIDGYDRMEVSDFFEPKMQEELKEKMKIKYFLTTILTLVYPVSADETDEVNVEGRLIYRDADDPVIPEGIYVAVEDYNVFMTVPNYSVGEKLARNGMLPVQKILL